MTALPARREGRPAPESLAARRNMKWDGPPPYPAEPEVRQAEVDRGGVRCIELMPAKAERTIVYFHGGGYRLGSPEGWTAFGGHLARRCLARVVIPDYALAPEHPFPAALHDAVAAYEASRDGGPMFVGGDSAGGGLAAALALALDDKPGGAFLFSPWLDMAAEGESYSSRVGRDLMWSRESAIEAADLYLQGHPVADPLVSPLHGDLTGFPPTLIFAGGEECLLSDGAVFAHRLALAGGAAEAHLVPGMQHVWPTMQGTLPESVRAIDAVVRFVGNV